MTIPPLWRCPNCPVIIVGAGRTGDVRGHEEEHEKGKR